MQLLKSTHFAFRSLKLVKSACHPPIPMLWGPLTSVTGSAGLSLAKTLSKAPAWSHKALVVASSLAPQAPRHQQLPMGSKHHRPQRHRLNYKQHSRVGALAERSLEEVGPQETKTVISQSDPWMASCFLPKSTGWSWSSSILGRTIGKWQRVQKKAT